MSRTIQVGLLVLVIASSVFVTLYATGFITLPFGSPKTTTPKTIFKSANTTATNQLLINSTKPAIQSATVKDCNPSTVTLSNVRFPSNWFEVTVNASESCSVIINLDYPSSYNVTFSGLSSGMAWASGGSVQLTIYTNFSVANVKLTVDIYSYASSTNVTMNLRNNGSAAATLVSYNITDTYGNTWTRTAWSTSLINPNTVVPTSFLVGSSCPSARTLALSMHSTVLPIGNTYYVTVVVSTSQSFKFSLNR